MPVSASSCSAFLTSIRISGNRGKRAVRPGAGDITRYTQLTPTHTHTLTFLRADTYFPAHEKQLTLVGENQRVSGMNRHSHKPQLRKWLHTEQGVRVSIPYV